MILYTDFGTADANINSFARAQGGVGRTHRQIGVRRRIDDIGNGVFHHDLAGNRGNLVAADTNLGWTHSQREGIQNNVGTIP